MRLSGLRIIVASGAFLVLARASVAQAATFEIGPGKPYASIGAVPWEALQAGDTVLIHWRTNAYAEKWVICRQRTAMSPITVRGVPGPGGELPMIDGIGATTRSALNYWNENRSIIKIGGANVPPDTTPRHIVIENLDLRGARPPFSFQGANSMMQSYNNNAAAIHVEKGENITVRNCRMHDCGNGFFVASSDALASRDILVEGNDIFDNGNDASIYEHNNYTAAINITFQYNRFGPLRPGCLGNNLKDRSAGLVVRYNWIEGGNRQLDLVDGEDSALIRDSPLYRKTYVYGNVLIEPAGAGNRQIVHYGGDSGVTGSYRKAILHFYHNTVVSTRTDRTTLFRLSTNDEETDCRNNIVYVTAAGSTLSILDETGLVNLTHNWFKPGWVNTFGALSGVITNDGSNLSGPSPGFLDEARQILYLATNSSCRDAGATLHADALDTTNLVVRHYLLHPASAARPNYQALDLGAYEFWPVEAWRYANFGTNATNALVAGDLADPNGNGVPNLLEYAFVQNPNGATGPGLPAGEILGVSGADYFAVRFNRRPPPAEVRYVVQVSGDLQGWQDGSSYADAGDVLTNAQTSDASDPGADDTVVRLNQPISNAPRSFLRVQVGR